jgi:hypothetical protein
VRVSRKISVNYYEYKNNIINILKNQGSPGYKKGMPLNVGYVVSGINPTTSKTIPYINSSVSGFYLRGADNNGQCYFVNNPQQKNQVQ